ncbi:protein DBF4 homolog A [Stegastes partitus]|uniref:Protein DBF4 homolog A n=1 Tax=Stegastes partitus TaxID=144197 RepID=A0A3B5BJ71_9TELE|nr:PREDICTED: protein DBF4 homolog A [Stegastes partitus]
MKENKMKPKRTQRPTGAKWEGKGGSAGDKTTLSHMKITSLVSSAAAQVKPFAGKVFYLDLPSNRIAERLEADIKDLGGIVEKFFSKEIKYLVSNKREARYVRCLRHDSPVPSPDSGQSSPQPRSNPRRPDVSGDSKSRSQVQTDAFATSRGKSLVERVVKEQERVQMNKILSNALEWGVKILYIDDVLAYVQKKKRIISSSQVPAAAASKTTIRSQVKAEPAAKQVFQKCKGGRISKPFIKVEDSSRHYRPIYLTMPNMPEFNLKTVAPCSPFCPDEKDPVGTKQRGHRGAKASGSEEKAHGRKKNRDKKRGGYCECCMIKYDSLTMHLQSDRHKAFSKSDKYSVVDGLVSALSCNFVHIRTKVKRPKCSVSSVLIVPGPRGRTDLGQKGDLDPSETVDGDEGSHSGHNLKKTSTPDSASLILRERYPRNCNTYWDRSKHKSLARKRPCRQDSCTQKAKQAQVSRVKLETDHSFPFRVPQTDQEDLTSHQDRNTRLRSVDARNEISSKSIDEETNVHEDPDLKKDPLLFEAAKDRNVSPETVAVNNLSEKEEEEESRPTQSFSLVRKIQRRVRVYKRKRRKVDTSVEKPRDDPDSMLSLWKLFQSSDDMDVEFHGFPDKERSNELKG